jgi:hypothetical protein
MGADDGVVTSQDERLLGDPRFPFASAQEARHFLVGFGGGGLAWAVAFASIIWPSTPATAVSAVGMVVCIVLTWPSAWRWHVRSKEHSPGERRRLQMDQMGQVRSACQVCGWPLALVVPVLSVVWAGALLSLVWLLVI